MSVVTDRIVADFARAARERPAFAAPRRRAALAALEAVGLPVTRDENWRYANLRALERLQFLPAAGAALPGLKFDVPAPLPGFTRFLFVDGVLVPEAPAARAAAAARITTLADSPGEPTRGAPHGDERFALLNQTFATDGLRVQVPVTADAVQLELLFIAAADAAAGASYPRLELELEPGARLTVIERHLSANATGSASFVNGVVCVDLGRGAQLEHFRLQGLNAHCIHFDTLSAQLAAGAAYRLNTVSIGAQSSRLTLAVRLAGEGAALDLAMVALGDGPQVQDACARIEHAAGATRTKHTFRGIAAGRARVACNSQVRVAAGAVGADSRQSLRGLLAGPEAEIDLRPQLEIHTDEVRCSHGATAGKLDDAMLFYLLSRGLSPDAAQRLLKWAFLEDVIAEFRLPQLRREIEDRLVGKLGDETLRELI